MIRVRHRGTTRSTPLLILAALIISTVLVPAAAQAQTIAQTQAEIAQLSATLSHQQQVSETTANQYDAAKVSLQTDQSNIVSLDSQVVVKRAAIVVTTKELVTAVVRAYVLGAADAQILALFDQNVTDSDARNVYEAQVVGDLNKIKNVLVAQKQSLDSTIAKVARQRAHAQQQTDAMQSLLAQNVRNENQTQATLTDATRKLKVEKVEIINYEIQVGAAAARKRDTAGEEQAVAAASAVGGTAAANLVLSAIAVATPPAIIEVAGSAQGNLALSFAIKEIGVPYVWGGETPGVGFDCSGLVQWAWAKAGISIPRTTQSEWPALHHVALTALQPGDLLFYYNLDNDHQVDHVVMYAGSGPYGKNTIIAAAHTGTNVDFEPLFTFGLIGAARP
jgi:cell wall-associated NlpC family hydrolase